MVIWLSLTKGHQKKIKNLKKSCGKNFRFMVI